MGEVLDLKKAAEESKEKAVESFRKIVENSIDYADKARLHCLMLIDFPFVTTIDAYVFFVALSDAAKYTSQLLEEEILEAFKKSGIEEGEVILSKLRELIESKEKAVQH